MSAAPPSANGLSQVIDGVSESSGLSPVTARPSATTAKTSSDTTWARISTFWNRAETSVPITHSAVIARMTTHDERDHDRRVLGQVVEPEGQQPEPDGRVGQRADRPARPVIAIAQPPIQPSHGPIARVTQENVVPQSWSALLR